MKKAYDITAFKCPFCSHSFVRNVFIHAHKKTKCKGCQRKFLQVANILRGAEARQTIAAHFAAIAADLDDMTEGINPALVESTIRGDQVPPSASEFAFKKRSYEHGYLPHRPSWPDFLLQTPDGLIAVEVKSKTDSLSIEQAQTFNLLESLGLPVYIWKNTERAENRLIRWKPPVRAAENGCQDH